MINVREPDKVGPALEQALTRPSEVMQAIAAHTVETHPWKDGRCSERIVKATDQLVDSGTGHLKAKPKNRIRHWKMRSELNYFR
jgi:hypothetical protein